MSTPERQRALYLGGGSRIPLRYPDLEAAARRRMSRTAWAYVSGGAGLEETQQSNRDAFRELFLVPRMLCGGERNRQVELFGRRYPTPLLLCPIGVLEMVHAQADLAVARAARRLGIPMIFSNQASVAMEPCSRELGESPRWFQLYWSKSKELVRSLVTRAEKCGCEAIVVTLDTTLLGWRPRDLQLGSLPFAYGMGLAQYFSDPVFQANLDETARKVPSEAAGLGALVKLVAASRRAPGSFWSNLRTLRAVRGVKLFLDIFSRLDLTWSDLGFLRECTRLPVVLKGILHPEDARKAVDAGVDAVMVSNHGGRQVDGSIPAVRALPAVVRAVAGRVPVLFDSGIRGGADVMKALALGAAAVGVGRPYLYGLALGGEGGVVEVLENILAELDLQMSLSGCSRLEDVRASLFSETP